MGLRFGYGYVFGYCMRAFGCVFGYKPVAQVLEQTMSLAVGLEQVVREELEVEVQNAARTDCPHQQPHTPIALAQPGEPSGFGKEPFANSGELRASTAFLGAGTMVTEWAAAVAP